VSRENVDVVRRAIDAFSRRDLDGAIHDAHNDIEVDWSRSRGVEAGIYRGREATRRFWNTFLEAFAEIEVVPEELITRGDQVILCDHTRLRGRDGIQVEARNVTVVTLQGGLILEWRLCRSRDEALEMVGLSPGSGGG